MLNNANFLTASQGSHGVNLIAMVPGRSPSEEVKRGLALGIVSSGNAWERRSEVILTVGTAFPEIQ